MNIIPAFFVLAITAAQPNSNPSASDIDQVRAVLVQTIAEGKLHKDDPQADQLAQNAQRMLQEVEYLEGRDDSEIERMVAGVVSQVPTPKVQQACDAFLKRVRAQRAAKDLQFTKGAEEALTRAGEAMLKAKTARDLDQPLHDLAKYRQREESGYGPSAEVRRVTSRVQNAIQSVERWQDYFAALDAGDQARARNILSNMRDADDALGIPRSEILARSAKLAESSASSAPAQKQDVKKVLNKVHHLDDIAAALGELKTIGVQRNGEDAPVLNSLDAIAKSYAALKSGLPTNVPLSLSANADSSNELIAGLKAELILLALPRYLGAGENEMPMLPETVDSYLKQLIADAKQKQNWELLQRALSVSRDISRSVSNYSSFSSSDDTSALASFLAGQNQERAQQFSLAVSSYQTALKTGASILPAETIGERLAAIKKDHPKEFEEGMQRFLNPPLIDPFGRMIGGYPPGYISPAMRRTMGFNPDGTPLGTSGIPSPQPPTIAVPAVAPTASPSPSATSSPSPVASPIATPQPSQASPK